jgi:hypothetical protein
MAIPLAVIGGVAGAGALGGGLSQYSGASSANNNINSTNNSLDVLKGQLQGQGDTINSMATDAYNPLIQNFGSDMSAYRDIGMNDGKQFQYNEVDPFNYDINQGIQKFLDPSMDFQIKQATGAVEGSAANAGGLFSSATGKAVADRSQEIAKQSWKEALQAAMEDRGFESGRFDSDRDRGDRGVEFEADQYNRGLDRKTDVLGTLTGIGAEGTMNLAGEKIDTQRDVFSGMNDIEIQKTINDMQKQDDGWGAILGGALTGGAGAASGPLTAFLGKE